MSELSPAPDHTVASYRPCYRSYIFSPNTSPVDLQFRFLPNSPLYNEDAWASENYFVRWVIDSFQFFPRRLGRPWIIFHGDHLIYEGLDLDDESVEVIRRDGLNVFMYENLYMDNNEHNNLWTKEKFSRFLELEHISDFVERYGIEQPVTVYVSEMGLHEILSRDPRFSNLHFDTFNSYFLQSVEDCRQHNPPPEVPITKRFICLNFRYEAVREMLAAYLVHLGHDKDSLITFYHSHNRKELLWRLPFHPSDLQQHGDIVRGLTQMQFLLPLTLEATNPQAFDPAECAIPDFSEGVNERDHESLYRDYVPHGFVFVYSESRPFSPRSEISEKTIHPFFAKKPILPFAAPYFLKGLRDMGFKTFSDFWDESFDEIEDPAARFSAYLKTVKSISEKSFDEILEMEKQMRPILEHNREWIYHSVDKIEMQRVMDIARVQGTLRAPLFVNENRL